MQGFLILIAIGLIGSSIATASAEEQLVLEADNFSYDQDSQTASAKGNAVATYDQQKLAAESITYKKAEGKVILEDNLMFQDAAGNRFFAQDATFSDTLTSGEVNHINGVLSDNSRLAADNATRIDENNFEFRNVVYSPCKLCTNGDKHTPLWRITADEIHLDQTAEKLTYSNATFDLKGIPILYTPYLSHATPEATRKSGFLIPTYRSDSLLGLSASVPYYFNLAPNYDLTLTPTLTSSEGTILSGDWRHRTETGRYDIEASITNPKERDILGNQTTGRDLRGHIRAKGGFGIDEHWGWGFDIDRASDDTYLRRYNISNEDLLTSRLFSNYLNQRDFIGIEGISFQGLNQSDDPDTTPLILPLVTSHFERAATDIAPNARYTLDSSLLSLSRHEGVDVQRLSTKAGLHLPYLTNNGHVFKLSTDLRADAYYAENVITGKGVNDGFTGRLIPQVELNWRYPLIKQISSTQIMLEPLADFIVSPYGGNPDDIPNEDSQELELADENLFSENHFTGLDRVEGGPRTNYGFRGGITHTLGYTNFLFGQAYRTKTDRNFTEESGFADNFSDYVGRVNIGDGKHLAATYRFRSDKDDFTMRRNEVFGTFTSKPLQLTIGYSQLDEINDTFDRQEIYGSTRFRVTDHWSVTAHGRRDMDEGMRPLTNGGIADSGGWITTGTGLIYEDECFKLASSIQRDYTRDRDIEPSTSYTVKIGLKNLGSF